MGPAPRLYLYMYINMAHEHSYSVDFHYLAQIERKSLKILMKKLFSFVSGHVIVITIIIIIFFNGFVIVASALIFYLNFVLSAAFRYMFAYC